MFHDLNFHRWSNRRWQLDRFSPPSWGNDAAAVWALEHHLCHHFDRWHRVRLRWWLSSHWCQSINHSTDRNFSAKSVAFHMMACKFLHNHASDRWPTTHLLIRMVAVSLQLKSIEVHRRQRPNHVTTLAVPLINFVDGSMPMGNDVLADPMIHCDADYFDRYNHARLNLNYSAPSTAGVYYSGYSGWPNGFCGERKTKLIEMVFLRVRMG